MLLKVKKELRATVFFTLKMANFISARSTSVEIKILPLDHQSDIGSDTDCSGFISYQETDNPLDFRNVESYP